jgi:hypothetical protein
MKTLRGGEKQKWKKKDIQTTDCCKVCIRVIRVIRGWNPLFIFSADPPAQIHTKV